MQYKYTDKLPDFVQASPSRFNAVANTVDIAD